MANVNIKFNNKDYLLSCDDGQEESLKKLTKFLDNKYSELKDKLGNIGENKLLLITTIQLIDEYFDLKQKVTQQKIKLDEISSKFKEIKSLAIEYKKDKDEEIKKLNIKLEKFKEAIEESNNLYETMLDKTTQSLEKIISNTESLSKIQQMDKKALIRKTYFLKRKKHYFQISKNFFNPLRKLIEKIPFKKKITINFKVFNFSIFNKLFS